jgi:GAF domain-containing protein
MSREQRIGRAFVELADTVADDFDVIARLILLCERSVELLSADAAASILAGPDGRLELMASTTEQARLLELSVLQTTEGPSLDCYRTGDHQVNFSQMEDRWPHFAMALREAGYGAAYAVPLRLRGQVIGALSLYCVRPVTLSADELALAQSLCDVATIAVLQERTIRRSETLADQLQTALESRVLIEQAKGVLAERAGIDVEEAFALLRAQARDSGRTLQATARSIITNATDPNPAEPLH